ncbi:MAG: polysaccharide deacetylase family protein [Clostridia bacterium]|nr:polysaccharide deacetylase family protein [Clostridia bacterium]
MWQGKNKAVTFSFDDGVLQDKRLIQILDKYGLKCTFNLNSSLLGLKNSLDRNGKRVDHSKVNPDEVKELYKNHEVAVHTLTHPHLMGESEECIAWQVEEDRRALERLTGKPVVGMAYPYGDNDDRIADIIKRRTGVKYARTITSTHNFNLQENLLRFNPTVYYIEDCLFDIINEFLGQNGDKPQLLYIWGHSYEMDAEYITWEKFEEACKLLSGRKEIFYGTNSEVLL